VQVTPTPPEKNTRHFSKEEIDEIEREIRRRLAKRQFLATLVLSIILFLLGLPILIVSVIGLMFLLPLVPTFPQPSTYAYGTTGLWLVAFVGVVAGGLLILAGILTVINGAIRRGVL
jgi:hypothetical protein